MKRKSCNEIELISCSGWEIYDPSDIKVPATPEGQTHYKGRYHNGPEITGALHWGAVNSSRLSEISRRNSAI